MYTTTNVHTRVSLPSSHMHACGCIQNMCGWIQPHADTKKISPYCNDSLPEMGGVCPEIGGWYEIHLRWGGGYIEQCSGFRGVSKAGKARERGVQFFWQAWDRGVLLKGGNKHTRTLNNTKWGGGGGGDATHIIKKKKSIFWRNSDVLNAIAE